MNDNKRRRTIIVIQCKNVRKTIASKRIRIRPLRRRITIEKIVDDGTGGSLSCVYRNKITGKHRALLARKGYRIKMGYRAINSRNTLEQNRIKRK